MNKVKEFAEEITDFPEQDTFNTDDMIIHSVDGKEAEAVGVSDENK